MSIRTPSHFRGYGPQPDLYFSAAAVNSDGIIPNNAYDRYNFTFRNTSYFLKDKLRF